MYINKISQQSFGISYSEIMLKTAQLVKTQQPKINAQKPSLFAQMLLKDKFFTSDKVSDTVKSNYFSYIINSINK